MINKSKIKKEECDMIQVKNVTKTFNETNKAVDNISFEVKPGEIVGFIGPNGSGKTTTLKLLTGIYQKDSGDIKVAGYDIDKEPLKAKKNIGYISDSPDMFLRLKGIEFLNLIADIYEVGTEKRKERIKKLTKAFGLEDILDSEMISYSHGMRQKMMVIAALIHEPDVWILDEPLIGLDPESAHQLKEMMKEHAKKGHTVLFSTHVLEVAEKLCDRIIIIKEGKIIYQGTLKELKKQYTKKDLEEIFLRMVQDEHVH